MVKIIETKNQWARDDPAFVVVQACFVAVIFSMHYFHVFCCYSSFIKGFFFGIRCGISISQLLGISMDSYLLLSCWLVVYWNCCSVNLQVQVFLHPFLLLLLKKQIIAVIWLTSTWGSIIHIVSSKKSSGCIPSMCTPMLSSAAFYLPMFSRWKVFVEKIVFAIA